MWKGCLRGSRGYKIEMVVFQRIIVAVVCFHFLSLSPVLAKPDTDNTDLTNSSKIFVQDSLLQLLEKINNQKDQFRKDQTSFESFIEQNALPLWDTRLMTRTVVGKQTWNSTQEQKREALHHAFRNTLLRYFILAFRFYDGQRVEFLDAQTIKEGKLVWLRSVISGQSMPKLFLDYQLRKHPQGKWLIVDIRLAGVSLMKNKRNEYQQIIQDKGVGGLVSLLEQKNKKVLSSKYLNRASRSRDVSALNRNADWRGRKPSGEYSEAMVSSKNKSS